MAITPKYNNDKVEIKVGFDCQGASMINEKGNKIPWRDGSRMGDINNIIQYQNMKTYTLLIA